jgi:hypothetical protein
MRSCADLFTKIEADKVPCVLYCFSAALRCAVAMHAHGRKAALAAQFVLPFRACPD